MLNKKSVLAGLIGNALENYDAGLYAFFAIILSPLFFPGSDPQVAMISSLGLLALGSLARPFGAGLFGYIGDSYGRKTALLISVFSMTLATLAMGLLPTYAQIGIWSPISLLFCRIIQELSSSGEYTGASLLIAESNPKRAGFGCSLMPASSMVGVILALLVSALCMRPGMPTWAWRIPFIAGAALGLLGFYLRQAITESPAFIHASQNQPRHTRPPLMHIITHHPRNFFCAMGVSACSMAPFYINTHYLMPLTAQFAIPDSYMLLMQCGIMLEWMLCILATGYFCDRIGPARIMKASCIMLIGVAFPVFWWIQHASSLFSVLAAQFVICISAAPFVAAMGAFVSLRLFPVVNRFTGIGLGSAIGGTLFGKTTPIILMGLIAWTGSKMIPAFYLIFCSLLGLAAVKYAITITAEEQKPLHH